MTLIISLRIPDGIVIAGDSLATMQTQLNVVTDVPVVCPQCGHNHVISQHFAGAFNVPSTTLPYSQKVFPFMGKFGVGTFGDAILFGKTIYFAVRELEQELKQSNHNITLVSEAADKIGSRIQELLRKQLLSLNQNLDNADNAYMPIGFHVVGYEADVATTIEVLIGKDITKNSHTGIGYVANGQPVIVNLLHQLYSTDQNEQPLLEGFSLQDAIGYAELLIGTTALHQQFSRKIPGVGGDIDVALVTPFDNFKWIKQKELSRILGGG